MTWVSRFIFQMCLDEENMRYLWNIISIHYHFLDNSIFYFSFSIMFHTASMFSMSRPNSKQGCLLGVLNFIPRDPYGSPRPKPTIAIHTLRYDPWLKSYHPRVTMLTPETRNCYSNTLPKATYQQLFYCPIECFLFPKSTISLRFGQKET